MSLRRSGVRQLAATVQQEREHPIYDHAKTFGAPVLTVLANLIAGAGLYLLCLKFMGISFLPEAKKIYKAAILNG